jgi:hypothetical protein
MSLASHRGGPGSPPGSMWGLWWTKRQWDRFSPSTSVSRANHSTNFSIIIITRGWHNRPIGGRSAEWTQLDSPFHYTNLKNKKDVRIVRNHVAPDLCRSFGFTAFNFDLKILNSINFIAEQDGSNCNAFDLFSEVVRFESRTGHRLSWLRYSCFSTVLPPNNLYVTITDLRKLHNE